MRRLLGVLVFAVGLWLTIYPFLSVWSVTGEALDQLPEIDAVAIETDRNWTAMFSDDFVLATRSYDGPTGREVNDALGAAAFEPTSVSGERWWAAECCGTYDAAWVRVEGSGDGDGRPVAIVSVYDADIQATWPFISGLGLLVSLIGVSVATSHRRGTTLDEELVTKGV